MAFIACARRSPITSNHQSGFGHFPYDVPIWIVVCLVMIHIACCYVWFCSPTRDHSFILTLGLAGLQQRACSSSGFGWFGSKPSVSGCCEKDPVWVLLQLVEKKGTTC